MPTPNQLYKKLATELAEENAHLTTKNKDQVDTIECLKLSLQIEKNEAGITKKIVEAVAEKLNIRKGIYTGELEKEVDRLIAQSKKPKT